MNEQPENICIGECECEEECVWTKASDNPLSLEWKSACGGTFAFYTDPISAEFACCPFCGADLVVYEEDK